MRPSETAHRHQQELVRRGYRVFRLLDVIEGLPLPEDRLETVRQRAIEVCDTAVRHGVEGEDGLAAHLSELAQRQPELVLDVLSGLLASLVRIRTSPRAMRFVMRRVAPWVLAVLEEHRGAFLRLLPQLAPACLELGDPGMQEIISAVNDLSSAPGSGELLGWAASCTPPATSAGVGCGVAGPAGVVAGVCCYSRRFTRHGHPCPCQFTCGTPFEAAI